jgi:hypothetical protein
MKATSQLPRFVAACGIVVASAAAIPASAAAGPLSILSADGSSSYALEIEAGHRVRAAVQIFNSSRTDRVVRLATVPLGAATAGGVTYGARAGRGPSGWVRLTAKTVRVPAKGSEVVSFMAEAPDEPGRGDRYAGITAVDVADVRRAERGTSASKRPTASMSRITRYALPIRFRLPGARKARLTLQGLRSHTDAGGGGIAFDLAGTGTKLIGSAKVDLRIAQDGRTVKTVHGTLGQIVPESRFAYDVPLPGVPEGEYVVTGTIRPEGAPAIALDRRVRFSTQETSGVERQIEETLPNAVTRTELPPWALMAAAAITLLLAVALVGLLIGRRRRRRREDEFEAKLAALQAALERVPSEDARVPAGRH